LQPKFSRIQGPTTEGLCGCRRKEGRQWLCDGRERVKGAAGEGDGSAEEEGEISSCRLAAGNGTRENAGSGRSRATLTLGIQRGEGD
jgi:hypothetical protein